MRELLTIDSLTALLRWAHVFSAILWIGQTYLFHRIDRNLVQDPNAPPGTLGHAWMVHGGGFFRVEKQKYSKELPRPLLWFQWESAATWLSGAVLLTLVYYRGWSMLALREEDFGKALGIGLGAIVAGWLLYDTLARTPVGRILPVMGLIGLAAFMGLAYGLRQVMTPRAAFLHVGALIGTVMAANVWLRILPSQRRMLALSQAGGTIEPALAAVGPQRSKHNSFLVMPLILVMMSFQYSAFFAHPHSWAVLGGMLVVGWGGAKLVQG